MAVSTISLCSERGYSMDEAALKLEKYGVGSATSFEISGSSPTHVSVPMKEGWRLPLSIPGAEARVYLWVKGIVAGQGSSGLPTHMYLNLPIGADPLKYPERFLAQTPAYGLYEASQPDKKGMKRGLSNDESAFPFL